MMLWQLLKYATFSDSMWSSYLKLKGRDRRKWPQYPWSDPDPGSTKKHGHVAPEHRLDAAKYLLTL